VVDQTGAPVPGAVLVGWASDPDRPGGTMSVGGAEADAAGRLCLSEEEEGWGYMTVEPSPSRGGRCSGHLSLGTRRVPAVIVMPVQRMVMASVTGAVVDPEGKPVAGATLEVDNLAIGPCGNTDPGMRVTTGTDGAFTIRTARGDLDGRVWCDGFAEGTFHAAAGSTKNRIVIPRGASWSGRVAGADGAVFIPSGVLICDPGNDCKRAARLGDTYSVEHLRAGLHTLRANFDRDPVLGTRRLEVAFYLDPEEKRVGDVVVAAGLDITGTTLPGISVHAVPKGDPRPPNRLASSEVRVLADAQGHFAFHRLAPGTWLLSRTAQRQGGIEVPAGTTGVRLRTP
jgi:hypothetical protein